jgi:hypothetical protein
MGGNVEVRRKKLEVKRAMKQPASSGGKYRGEKMNE